VALMRHTVVECVWPDRDTGKRGGDGGIIDKELVSHHLKLLVSSDSKIWSTDTDHRSVSNIGKSLDDESDPAISANQSS